jgi:hypothetical protein
MSALLRMPARRRGMGSITLGHARPGRSHAWSFQHVG